MALAVPVLALCWRCPGRAGQLPASAYEASHRGVHDAAAGAGPMTRVLPDGNILLEETRGTCSLCGRTDDVRPFGDDDEVACLDCAEASPAVMAEISKRFREALLSADVVFYPGGLYARKPKGVQ